MVSDKIHIDADNTTSSERAQLRDLLLKLYGRLEEVMGPTNWWPAETPFEVCVGAILTQNALWSGVVKAIANLRKRDLFDVQALADADEQTLADALRPSIYYNQKAKKLRAFCRFLTDKYGGRIENMAALTTNEARNILLALPGIGPETADSMLNYALDKPVFVVDAYTRRVFSRHGLCDPAVDYESLRMLFMKTLEPDAAFYGEFHALICLLGANHCRKKPLCRRCPARDILGEPIL